jgi:TRAP-type C4-dicarboxylate transport system permease small subunit
MNPLSLTGVILIVLGLLGLGYGSFSYTKDTHKAKIGPLELSVKETQTVNVPAWAGGAAIVIGLGLLIASGRKR